MFFLDFFEGFSAIELLALFEPCQNDCQMLHHQQIVAMVKLKFEG
jgi:hypothetical protein